jgi:signal transduction histidine kinase
MIYLSNTFLLFAGTMAMGILSLSIIIFYVAYQKRLNRQITGHQKELLESTIQVQEKERKRFSEDLHDELGSLLSAIKLKIDLAKESEDLKHIEQATLLVDEALETTRRVSRAISPALIEKFGLQRAIADLAERHSVENKISVKLRTEGVIPPPEKKAEISLFRIVQEFLNNTIKHGKATEINIFLASEDKNELVVIFEDNGLQFNIEEMLKLPLEKSGIGLKNIESRLTMLNARIFYSDDKKGFNRNIIKIPLD